MMVNQQASTPERRHPQSIFTTTAASIALLYTLLSCLHPLCDAFVSPGVGGRNNALPASSSIVPKTSGVVDRCHRPTGTFVEESGSGNVNVGRFCLSLSSSSTDPGSDVIVVREGSENNDGVAVMAAAEAAAEELVREEQVQLQAHSHSHSRSQAQSRTSDDVGYFSEDTAWVLKGIKNGTDDTLIPAIFAESPLSITYVWNLDMWAQHTSRTRYIRHVKTLFSSRLSRRIFPQFALCTLWSLLSVNVLTSRWLVASTHFVPFTSLSMISTFVGFCLTLRSNQGLARLSEGRKLWGRAFIVLRDTAQILAAYAYPKEKELGLTAARHLSIFAWLLKGHLRNTDDTPLIQTMLPSTTDRTYLTSQRKTPVAAITRVRQIVASLASRNVIPLAAHQQLESNLNELNYVVGMCERIAGSPVPPVYTSHTSRLLVFYLVCMPLALHGMALKKTVTVLVTAIIGYTMLGLDEISHVLEQPFRLMPLHQLSRNIMLDVADAFVCRPPGLGEYPDRVNNTVPEYW